MQETEFKLLAELIIILDGHQNTKTPRCLPSCFQLSIYNYSMIDVF